jgi:serine/threonine protein kinase
MNNHFPDLLSPKTMGNIFCCNNTDTSSMDSVPTVDVIVADKDWKMSSIFADYKFIEQVGKGGNAEVWKAQNIFTKKMVAVKMSRGDKNSCEDLVKEFTVLKKFDSTYIVAPELFYYGRKNVAFMIMDLYHEDLFSLIVKNERLDEKTLQMIARQVGLAVKLVHDADLVHRDIKPDNIFLRDDKTCILGDFGGVEHVDKMTISVLVGTSSYMAPEVAMGTLRPNVGNLTVGKPVDIYSLGQTLYTAATVTNAIPFASKAKEIIKLTTDIDMLPLIDKLDRSEYFKDLLRGMLDYHPIQRLTIQEVLKHPFVTRNFW